MSEQQENYSLSRWDFFAVGGGVGLLAAWFFFRARLPLRVPTHFDFAGRANGWTDRAHMPWLVFGLPVGVWLLMWLLDLAMRGADEETAARMAVSRPLRGIMTLGICGIGLAILVIPLYGLWLLWVALGFLFACLGVGIWECVLRMRVMLPADEGQFYRWGLFYVNPQDERIWVPKRLGMGWTLNFGRPAGWLMLMLLLTPIFLVLAIR